MGTEATARDGARVTRLPAAGHAARHALAVALVAEVTFCCVGRDVFELGQNHLSINAGDQLVLIGVGFLFLLVLRNGLRLGPWGKAGRRHVSSSVRVSGVYGPGEADGLGLYQSPQGGSARPDGVIGVSVGDVWFTGRRFHPLVERC